MKRTKKTDTATRDLTWTARTFGPTEFGARGIEWYREETSDTGSEIRVVHRQHSVQCRELSTELQRELRDLIAFSSVVNQRVESILRRHLEGKK